jgi:hypothetical protein
MFSPKKTVTLFWVPIDYDICVLNRSYFHHVGILVRRAASWRKVCLARWSLGGRAGSFGLPGGRTRRRTNPEIWRFTLEYYKAKFLVSTVGTVASAAE